ncbi:hypothetical protein QCO44_08395 [Selenomonas sputigena]|uniref:Uncharacterized protein n=1 Tax=Selenomonas sputigena TaxID=69823 RepID=A0ABV3X619_9FIRM
MILMTDHKLFDEITIVYDTADGVEEKLRAFLSSNNEIKRYVCAVEEKIYKITIEMTDTIFQYGHAGNVLSGLVSLMSYKAGGRYFFMARPEDYYGEFLTFDEDHTGLYFQLTFKFPN